MNVIAVHSPIGSKFSEPKLKSNFASSDFERYSYDLDDFCSLLVDTHRTSGAHIHYLRIRLPKEPLIINFSEYDAIYQVFQNSEFGMLLRVGKNNNKFTIWLPSIAYEIRLDDYQRMSCSQNTFFSYKWEFIPEFRLTVSDFHADGALLTIPYIVFKDASGDIFKEFNEINKIERRLFRKSDWFYASSPSDIWNYLINGSIYDPRSDKLIKKRFKCQQCAYSWWNYFGLLKRETGKTLYTILQDEVAFSVLMDLSSEGEWGHGYWSDDIETHARFHLDGIHLLISQYEKTKDSVWLQAAERGMEFVFDSLTDRFNEDQIWFLHDTIEHVKIHHVKSALFGKSPGNSLCINTHVQALTVLNRLILHLPDKKNYSSYYNNACNALRKVLEYRPAEVSYKLLAFLIVKIKTRKNTKSILGKILKSIGYRLLHRIYWPMQRLFPRLVHPNGFIERDLTLTRASDRYHVINIKDLLTLYQQDPLPWLAYFIREGMTFLRRFVRDVGLSSNLAKSPFYIEFIDILFLYNKFIGSLPPEEMKIAEETILKVTGGYSIDLFASPLIRQGRPNAEYKIKQSCMPAKT